jgi:hypothetical protein
VPDAVAAANRDKISLIAAAQKGGRFSDRFPAAELLVLITGLSILGVPYLAMPNDQGQRRRSVVEAVRLLTEREGEHR